VMAKIIRHPSVDSIIPPLRRGEGNRDGTLARTTR
jgi:hypothetical protein